MFVHQPRLISRVTAASVIVALVVVACSSTAATPTAGAPTPGPATPGASASAVVTPAPPSFTLKIGVLGGLTGIAASSGIEWADGTRIGVDYVNETLAKMGLSSSIKVELTDSQDSQANATAGVEATKKLVNIDGVQAIVGDFFSSVTAAEAQITIPAKVLVFTGGTNPSLTQLNGSGQAYLWQIAPADDNQGKLLAQVVGEDKGKTAKISVGFTNDAYGNGLASVFKTAWTAGGGTLLQYLAYDPSLPSFDTEAQKLVQGSPDAWVFVDYCGAFPKMLVALQRTGKWDPTRTYGGDALAQCLDNKVTMPAGVITTGADYAAGPSNDAMQALFVQKGTKGVAYSTAVSQPFDAVILVFLAALAAGSNDTTQISKWIPKITNPPATEYDFTQLQAAITAVLKGDPIHFVGNTGPFNFNSQGREDLATFLVKQYGPNGVDNLLRKASYQPQP